MATVEWASARSWTTRLVSTNFDGTEAEVEAVLSKHWDDFVETPYCKALVARAEEIYSEAKKAYALKLQKQGRFKVGYGPSRKDE